MPFGYGPVRNFTPFHAVFIAPQKSPPINRNWSSKKKGKYTFVHARQLVFEYGEFVDFSEFFKHRTQVGFFQIAWNLPDKEFDGFGFLVLLLLLLLDNRSGWRMLDESAVVVDSVRIGADPLLLLLLVVVLQGQADGLLVGQHVGSGLVDHPVLLLLLLLIVMLLTLMVLLLIWLMVVVVVMVVRRHAVLQMAATCVAVSVCHHVRNQHGYRLSQLSTDSSV